MKIFLTLLFVALGICSFAQQIFTETDFEYRKDFAPYEVNNIFPLEEKDFVVLKENGKGEFRLIRYDKYFFEKWANEIDFDKEGSFPFLFQRDDAAILFRIWTEENVAIAESRSYDISTGNIISEKRTVLSQHEKEIENLQISFAENKESFLVYGLPSQQGKAIFEVYDLLSHESKNVYSLPSTSLDGKTIGTWLRDSGELFLALADAGTFTLDTYYYSPSNPNQPGVLSSNFAFNRPADALTTVKIIPQSESTLLVATSAKIEDELIGMNVSSFNVVLHSLLFSNNLNFDREFILDSYANSLFTSKNQKKKHITTPEELSDFHLHELIKGEDGNITCVFEMQELPSGFHNPATIANQELKWEEDDKSYESEDLLFINFSSEGMVNWKKVIQKTQKGFGHGLTTSYLPYQEENNLRLVLYESAKGNSMYRIDLDLENGKILNVYSFFEKSMEFNKNYSTWLDDKTLLLCAFKPGSSKRSFYLVEF